MSSEFFSNHELARIGTKENKLQINADLGDFRCVGKGVKWGMATGR